MLSVICSLCGQRKARRACPALGKDICAVCCGTKRLGEIRCPASCGYLAAAREHPAAAVVRQRQRDLSQLVHVMRDFNERQGQLFLSVSRFLVGYRAPELQAPIDDDIAEAATALAATYETSVRGVIYEHRAGSLPAERLVSMLKPLLADAARAGGTAFERDAIVVLRRLAEAAKEAQAASRGEPRAFLDLLGRVLRASDAPPEDASAAAGGGAHEPRLIIP